MSTPTASPTPPSSAPRSSSTATDELRREVQVTLAGRQEMGPTYDEHFADALVERLNTQIQREVDRQVRLRSRGAGAPRRGLSPEQRLGLAIPSLIFLIPLIAIAGFFAGLTGIIVACAAVIAVNIAAGLF